MASSHHPSVGYDDRAQRYADRFQDETLPMFPLDRNMIRMLVDLVGSHPRVLDAGCGAGQVTKMLQNWGCDAVGVDAAEKLIELARSAYPGIDFTVGDLRALPYRDEDFDAVVARYSVIHTEPVEVPSVLAEFARVLRPGGCLLVEFQVSGRGPTRPFDHAAAPAWHGTTTNSRRSSIALASSSEHDSCVQLNPTSRTRPHPRRISCSASRDLLSAQSRGQSEAAGPDVRPGSAYAVAVSDNGSWPARVDDVHELVLAMPHVTVEYGTGDNPVYQVGGKSFIFFRNPRPDAVDPETGQRYPDVIVFWVESEADKQALVQDETSPFFTTAHFDGHPSVLLRASRVGELTRQELAEVIQDAWLSRASARRTAAWLSAHRPR